MSRFDSRKGTQWPNYGVGHEGGCVFNEDQRDGHDECLPALTEEDRKAMDSLPNDLVEHLCRGEWWHDGRYWTARDAVYRMKELEHALIAQKKQVCHRFRVRDTRERTSTSRHGLCYAFYDHFDVVWDDGILMKGVADLSYNGIFRDEPNILTGGSADS